MNSESTKNSISSTLQNEKDFGQNIARKHSQLYKNERIIAPKKNEIENLDALLISIYTGALKRKKLTKKEIAKIQLSASPTSKTVESITQLVKTDYFLQKTKLALLVAFLTENNLRTRISNLLIKIISQHPIFQQIEIPDSMYDFCDYSKQQKVIDNFLKIDFYRVFTEGEKITPKMYTSCKENTLHCILLIFAIHGVDAKRIIEIMRMCMITKGAKQTLTGNDRIMFIILSKDPMSVLYEYEIISQDNLRLASDIDNKNIILNKIESEVVALKGTIEDLNIRINEKDASLEVCAKIIKEKEEFLEQTKIIHCDNMVKIKGRMLHRIKSEVRLLENGLIALQRNPPKVDIMIDHAERAISGLKAEIENLC